MLYTALFCELADMGDSILSQAEIDALLNGSDKNEPTPVSQATAIFATDPNTQRRVVRERLQALEIINRRFARRFRMGLFNLLRRGGYYRGCHTYSAVSRICA